jgi:hypothetical protein
MIPAVVFGPPGSGAGCLDGDIGQCLTDVAALPGQAASADVAGAASAVSGAVGDVASSAWDSICHSFADAFTSVLKWFGGVFASMPDPDLGSIHGVYAISLTLGMIVAVFLLVLQAGSVVWTRSGAPLAQALTGLPKAVVASLLTLAVSGQIMAASDDLANWIVTSSGTSMTGFTQRLTTLLVLSSPTGPAIPSVLLLLFGLVGIVVVLMLWLELVLRNAVFCILVATAPIGAAGQIGSSTQEWWRKLVKAGVQLAMVKPVIALVFVIGFDTAGSATGITGVVSGMAVLFMAVFAWPVIGRLFTFTSATVGGAMGAGALVGAVANRTASGGAGVDPAAFGQFSERQAMAANAGRGAGAGAAGTSALGLSAGPAGVAAAAIQTLHKTINAVASRMEQQAGHAGLEGSNPTAYPAGYPTYGSVRMPRRAIAGSSNATPSDSVAASSAGTATNNGKA